MTLIIHPVEDGDVPALVALWDACALTRPWNDPHADIAHARANAGSTILLGMADGVLSASVMVGFDGHRGWVYYLAVRPDARGRGHGRAMMAAAERWLRDRGAPKLQLMVRDTNLAALGFYARLGLETQSVVVLGKWLDESTG